MLLKSSLSAHVKQLHERYQTTWSALVSYFNTSIVSVYKLAGFILLTVIVFGMFAYLATTGFYFFSNKWMAPAILNPSNEKVITAYLNFLDQEYALEKMDSELLSLKKELEHIGFASTAHADFQDSFTKALESERSKYVKELGTYQKLLLDYKSLAAGSKEDSGNYRQNMAVDLEEQYSSHLIDREELLKGKHLINQLDASGLSQEEKYADLKRKTEDMRKTVKALEETKALMVSKAPATEKPRANYDMNVLLQEQPYIDASIARSELSTKEQALTARIVMLESLVTRYRASVDRIRSNPYVRASQNKVTIAFVPYENLGNVKADMPIVGCFFEFIACKKVGHIVQILDGEVVGRHPVSGREIRGQMIEVQLKDEKWAESRSLIANRAPFLL